MSSPSLKDEEKTSNNAESTVSNRPQIGLYKGLTRHFPGLGILTKIVKTSISVTALRTKSNDVP